jgi:thioredoxin-like negative regulator of GroEL
VIFYKVNADKEKELCEQFDVRALPTLFFIRPGEKPVVEVGADIGKCERNIEALVK